MMLQVFNEELPPHLTYRVEGVRNDVLIPGISSAANGIFLRAKAWPPDLDKNSSLFYGRHAHAS